MIKQYVNDSYDSKSQHNIFIYMFLSVFRISCLVLFSFVYVLLSPVNNELLEKDHVLIILCFQCTWNNTLYIEVTDKCLLNE